MIRSGPLSLALVAAAVCACADPAGAVPAAGARPGPDQPEGQPEMGQSAVQRPLASKRLVAHFAFDTPEPYELPRHWDLFRPFSTRDAALDRRFPAWNTANLDYTHAYRSLGSVRLSTTGGSVRLRLDPGVVPVFPDTEYLVSARVNIRGLEHARAAIAARYLDGQAKPIAASQNRSDLIASTGDAWQLVTVSLPDGVGAAAYIQIDLEILQPEEHQAALLGTHQVWPQDLSGHAWFDDVAVVQVPRARISTSSPFNIIEHPVEPEITVHIRDLAGQVLIGQTIVQDAEGHVVDVHRHTVRGGTATWSWQPRLRKYGWYRAVLELSADDQRVGATYVDFAWLPERPGFRTGQDSSLFGIILDELPPQHTHTLSALMHHSGAGALTIPVWNQRLKQEEIPDFAQDLAQSVASLQMGATQVSFSLPNLPRELASAAHLDGGSPVPVFSQDESVWAPFLMPLLDRFGQSVQRWQVGEPGAPARIDSGGIAMLRDVLGRLVPGPVVAIPWPGEAAAGEAAMSADELFITIPSTLPASAIPAFVRMWAGDLHREDGRRELSFLIEQPPGHESSRLDAAIEMARKAIMLWSMRREDVDGSFDGPMFAAQPWAWPGGLHSSAMPRIELVVWRMLAEQLRGRRIVGKFPAGPGIHCFILAPRTGGRPGALIAWQNDAVESPMIEAYLGAGAIRTVDIFGNAAPVDLEPGSLHRVPVASMPLFIEGVDVELASFLASFRLEHGVLQPGTGEHHAAMVLSNPWRMHLQGRLMIVEPGGLGEEATGRDRSWHIVPRVMEFAIAPGQTAKLPIRVGFSAAEEHGRRELVADIELTAMQMPPIRVRSPMEIRLDDLELDLVYRLVKSGEDVDVVLEAIVTNRATTAATLDVSAFAAGYPRARASISDLSPGASAMRRFAFPAGGHHLKSRTIAISVQNAETGARINRSVRIE